jgi:glycosyltransferase involved in cell wall biosynthesis
VALAEAILRFYERGGRSAMEAGVRREAAKYTWDALAEAILDLVKETRAKRAAR